MEKKMLINKLPGGTWNWLKVNEAAIDWDEDKTAELPEEDITAESARLTVKGEGEYSRKRVSVDAAPGSSVTVFETFENAAKLAVETELTAREGACIRLVQIQSTGKESLLYNRVSGECAKNGRIELVQILIGAGDSYCDSHIELSGEGSGFKADIGYLGQREQKLDMNLAVDHWGKSTESEINAAGALKDAAHKVFRGTIDFKNGSSASVGNEKETVLMLGDDVVNKTVPLILCAEENVVGNHGATIGELDEDTLFYFESRGIDKQTAENILARAAIERLARLLGDSESEEYIMNRLNGEL